MNRLVRILRLLSRSAVDHPRSVWVTAAGLILLSITVAAVRIEFRTSNLDLVDPEVPEVSAFMSFAESFGTPNVLIVALEGEDADELQRAADDVAPALEQCTGVRHVMYRLPLEDRWIDELGLERYSMSDDRQTLYLFVQPQDVRTSAAEIEPMVRDVRRVLGRAGLDQRGVQAGLTGIPEYALNDKEFIQRDIKRLSLFALAGIVAVFAIGFRSWRQPFVAALCLMTGCVLTLGVASLFPGHITLLSASFVSILFGLGIDYGVHLIKRMEEFATAGVATRDAILHGLDCMYESLLTGALTTAFVFYGMHFSGLKGFAELGLIAGTGVLICLLCMITLLPAGLMMTGLKAREPRPQPSALSRGIRWGWTATLLITVLTAAAWLQPEPPFNSDYLAMEPVASEAVRLERAMIEGSGYSPEFAAFVFDTEVRAVTFADLLLDEPLVGEVRTLAGLSELGLPRDQVEKMITELSPQFVASDGRYAVYAYPAQNVWDPEAQEAFVERMRELNASVTGMPVIGQYMLEASGRALTRMSAIALGVLAVCLLFDLRSLRLAVAAMTPTLLTFVLMRLWMDLAGLDYNPINIMALPVILGIAVDDGVHIVHRFRQEKGDMGRTLWGTGRTVTITSLTSMISFGALACGMHRGLASFGLLLFIGVATALAVSLLWLPWVLHQFAPFWLKGGVMRQK